MNKIQLLVLGLLTSGGLCAQFVNNGATVTIQAGATLRVETDFQNLSGTIHNLGTLEVQGHFTNAAGSGTTLSGTGKVKFIGNANTNLTTNNDPLYHVEMAKTTSNGKVTLIDDISITGNLEFTGTDFNKIELGNYNLNLADGSIVSATTNHTTNGYVVTNGSGNLVKAVTNSAPPINMPIGSASAYAPIQVTMTGNAMGNVTARTLVTGLSQKYNDADAYINREWVVSTPTVTSTSLTGTYVVGDVTGNAANIKGCTFLGSGEWSFSGFGGAANSVTVTTTDNTDVAVSGQNFFAKYTSHVLMEGPKSGSSMNKNLTLPLTSPYTPAETVSAIPANVVDWVLFEVRDPNNHATILSQKSGFVRTDGSLIGLDGSSQLRNKVNNTTTGTGFVVIKHRNHLAIMTNASKDLVANPAMNFLNGSQATYGTNAMRNDAGIYSMWAGDAFSDNYIDASDRASTWNSRNQTGYLQHDCNLDGYVDASDRAITWNNRNKTITF